MSEHHRHLIEHSRFFHFVVEVISFASTLSSTTSHQITVATLSHAGTSEESHLPSLKHRTDEVYNFDTSFKNFNLCSLCSKFRCFSVNRKILFYFWSFLSVDCLSKNVEDASECWSAGLARGMEVTDTGAPISVPVVRRLPLQER